MENEKIKALKDGKIDFIEGVTGRGFKYKLFYDMHQNECSLSQSSSVISSIWLGIDEPKVQILASKIMPDGTGWANYPLPDGVEINSRMLLNQEQVKKLLPVLQKFAETGEI